MEVLNDWIGRWLSLPVPMILGVLVLLQVSWAAGLYGLIVGRRTRDFVIRWCLLPPLCVMPLTLMFSLLTGFLAAEIGQRSANAERAVADEGRALMTIDALTRTSQSRFGEIRTAAARYAGVVVSDEVPRFGECGDHPEAGAALTDLERVAAAHAFDPGFDGVVADRVLQAVLALRQARLDRSLVRRGHSGFQWITVLSLSLLSTIAIALAHAEKPPTVVAAIGLFIPAIVIVLGMLAVRENPFSPPISVSPVPIESAWRQLSMPLPAPSGS